MFEAAPVANIEEKGVISDGDQQWWDGWRKRLRTENGYVKIGKDCHEGRRIRKGAEEHGFHNEPDLDEVNGETRMKADVDDTDSEMSLSDEFRVLIKVSLLSCEKSTVLIILRSILSSAL